MTRFRRYLPLVGVALGAVLVPPLVGSATAPPDSDRATRRARPSRARRASSDPVDSGAGGARRRWLEFVGEADADTYAGGAPLRDLVEGERVLMIGDSIMASTSRRYGGEMCEELVPRGWEVEIDAETGRFVDFGDRVLDARLDADWDVAVVMLGNNYGADQGVFEEYLTEIVDRLAPRPTVLLTVTEFRPDRAEVNEVIYDIAADNENVRVVDWAAETADDPALVGGDGLHLSDLGRARYADLVGRELGRAPGFGEGDCLGSDFTDDSAITPQPGQVTPPPTNQSERRRRRRRRWRHGAGGHRCTHRAHDCCCSGSDDHPAADDAAAAAAADDRRRRPPPEQLPRRRRRRDDRRRRRRHRRPPRTSPPGPAADSRCALGRAETRPGSATDSEPTGVQSRRTRRETRVGTPPRPARLDRCCKPRVSPCRSAAASSSRGPTSRSCPRTRSASSAATAPARPACSASSAVMPSRLPGE